MNAEELAKLEIELQPEVARGQRARAILQSAGWKEDVEPYLKERESDLSKGSSWKPGGPVTVDLIAVGCAFNGGRQDECLQLKRQLLIWEEKGAIASGKLERARKKQ